MRLGRLLQATSVASLAALVALAGGAGANSRDGGAVRVTVSKKMVARSQSFRIVASGTLPTHALFGTLAFGLNSPGVRCASSEGADKFEFPPTIKNPSPGRFKYRERYRARLDKPGLHPVCAYLSFQRPGTTTDVHLAAHSHVRITTGARQGRLGPALSISAKPGSN